MRRLVIGVPVAIATTDNRMTVPDRAAPSAEWLREHAERAAIGIYAEVPQAVADDLARLLRDMVVALEAAERERAALVQRVRELEAAPTEYDEPPWRGWFSCEECGGWFTDNAGDTFENGSTVCHDCQSQRRLTAQVKTLRTALQSHHVEGLCPDCDAALTRTAWVD